MAPIVRSFGVAALVLSCRGAATVPTEGCARDEECAMTKLKSDCCSLCEAVAATKKSVDAMEQSCSDKPASARRCPQLDCPRYAPAIAKCVAGRCAAETVMEPMVSPPATTK